MLRKLIWLLLGVALGGAIYLAQRRAKETGRGFWEVVPEVPAEARRLCDAVTERLKDAIEAGREAAQEKQSDIQSILNGTA